MEAEMHINRVDTERLTYHYDSDAAFYQDNYTWYLRQADREAAQARTEGHARLPTRRRMVGLFNGLRFGRVKREPQL
jgi:hypothetical protein